MTRILHLSDIHLNNPETAETWRSQLEADLRNELQVDRLDWLVISGDIADKSTPDEYAAAANLVTGIMDRFHIKKDKLVIVPGNHDLNWKLSRRGYRLEYLDELEQEPIEGRSIPMGDDGILIRDDKSYGKRFSHFGKFHFDLTGKRYPEEHSRQGIVYEFPNDGMIFLGLNSAWEIDHHFKQRSGIHPNAVDHVLDRISGIDCDGWLKIAVCHHPVSGPAMMKKVDFLERLAVCGFQVILHGHIHEAQQGFYHYDPKREIHIVGSGTFGAPSGEMVAGIPLQYNLLVCDSDKKEITVHTRKKEKPEGAWSADARWGDKNSPVPYYTLKLKAPEQTVGQPSKTCARPPEDIRLEIPTGYRQWIEDQCKHMDVDRLREAGSGITISLPEVFIPLYTNTRIGKPEDTGDDLEFMLEREFEIEIEESIAENDSLLIEGEAGSGKTTLVKHMAYMMLREGGYKGLADWLPVLVFLKDFKDFDFGGKAHNAETAEQLLEFYFNRNDCCLDADTVKGYIRQGKALFLMDGLDEIERNIRDAVVRSFEALRRKTGDGNICWSGRPHGIDGVVLDTYGDKRVKIVPLSENQQETFVRRWFANVEGSESQAGRKTAEEMISEIRDNPGVRNLKDNPLMLTAICILYYDQKELPGQRAELYKKFVDNMLHRRFNDPEKVHNFLMTLARKMHMNRRKGIDKQPALEILGRVWPKGGMDEDQYRKHLENEFNRIEPGCGLLKFEGGQLMFRHLTFQEYLTAAAIMDKERKYDEAIANFWNDEWFREVIELYIGLLSIDNRNWSNFLIQDALGKPDSVPYYRWRLAARSLLDIHEDRREPESVELATGKLLEIIVSEAEPKDRADAGEILGWLGDPRDLEEFVPIPGGTYELSTGTHVIEPFEIAKYPVTNRWYGKFVDDGGYENESFWTEQGKKWLSYTGAKFPLYWYDRRWNCPNHPVLGVSWYEASAFCQWLTHKMKDGYEYKLPKENEWETAASGKEKRNYPWGDKYDMNLSNTKETGIGKTAPVGIFILGRTPEGIEDMSGNVWVWTVSDYDTSKSAEDFKFDEEKENLNIKWLVSTGEKRKILAERLRKLDEEKHIQRAIIKGGSWNRASSIAKCSSRYRYNAMLRHYNGGFRCIRKKVAQG